MKGYQTGQNLPSAFSAFTGLSHGIQEVYLFVLVGKCSGWGVVSHFACAPCQKKRPHFRPGLGHSLLGHYCIQQVMIYHQSNFSKNEHPSWFAQFAPSGTKLTAIHVLHQETLALHCLLALHHMCCNFLKCLQQSIPWSKVNQISVKRFTAPPPSAPDSLTSAPGSSSGTCQAMLEVQFKRRPVAFAGFCHAQFYCPSVAWLIFFLLFLFLIDAHLHKFCTDMNLLQTSCNEQFVKSIFNRSLLDKNKWSWERICMGARSP